MTPVTMVHAAILAAASYGHSAPPNNSAWDVLYIAIGVVVLLALVAGIGTYLNHRDDRRTGPGHPG